MSLGKSASPHEAVKQGGVVPRGCAEVAHIMREWEGHGFTRGCRGCRRAWWSVKSRQGHSEECRWRLQAAIPGNPKARVEGEIWRWRPRPGTPGFGARKEAPGPGPTPGVEIDGAAPSSWTGASSGVGIDLEACGGGAPPHHAGSGGLRGGRSWCRRRHLRRWARKDLELEKRPRIQSVPQSQSSGWEVLGPGARWADVHVERSEVQNSAGYRANGMELNEGSEEVDSEGVAGAAGHMGLQELCNARDEGCFYLESNARGSVGSFRSAPSGCAWSRLRMATVPQAQDSSARGDCREDFVATPPLGALKAMLSLAHRGGRLVLVLDAKGTLEWCRSAKRRVLSFRGHRERQSRLYIVRPAAPAWAERSCRPRGDQRISRTLCCAGLACMASDCRYGVHLLCPHRSSRTALAAVDCEMSQATLHHSSPSMPCATQMPCVGSPCCLPCVAIAATAVINVARVSG